MSFSQEIKDFLSSATSTYKLLGDQDAKRSQSAYTDTLREKTIKDMNDPLAEQQKEATLAHTRASTAALGRRSALEDSYLQAYKDSLKATPAADTVPATNWGNSNPPLTAGGAIPAGGAPTNPYGYGMAKGGLVPHYQMGGGVSDDDEDDMDAPQYPPGYFQGNQPLPPQVANAQAAAPAPAVGPGAGPTPMPRPRPQAIGGPAPPQYTGDVVSDAQKYGLSHITPLPPGPGRQRGMRAYAAGAGAAPVNDMLAIYKKIDPHGEMTDGERNLRAMQIMYDYKLKTNPQEAQQTAFQMLQYHRQAVAQYAGIAKAALDNGQVTPALKSLMHAYANVPDGNDMKLWQDDKGRISYSFKNDKGETVSQGIATPDEISGAAMNLMGGGMEQILAQRAGRLGAAGGKGGAAAGQAAAGPDAAAGDVPKKPGDYDTIRKSTDASVDKYVEDFRQKPEGQSHLFGLIKPDKEITDKEIGQMKNVLYHVRRNNDLTDEEGIDLTQRYLNAPDKPERGKPTMRVDRSDPNMRTVIFSDGRQFSMPTSDYASLAAMRGEAIAGRDAADKKKAEGDKDEGYGPKFARAGSELYAQGKEAIGGLASDVANDVKNQNLLGAVARIDKALGAGMPVGNAATGAIGAVNRAGNAALDYAGRVLGGNAYQPDPDAAPPRGQAPPPHVAGAIPAYSTPGMPPVIQRPPPPDEERAAPWIAQGLPQP